MRSTRTALFLFCLLFLFSLGAARPAFSGQEQWPDPLRVAINMPYPPFCYYDQSGAATGFDIDFALALCTQLGRECELKLLPVAEIIPAFERGELDFAVAGLGINEARRKVVNFTDKYYRSRSIFIGREGELSSIEPEALKGLTIGVRTGTLQEGYVRQRYSAVAKIAIGRTMEDLFELVKSGQADLAFMDGLGGYYLLKQEAWEGLDTVGEPVAVNDDTNLARIAVAKNSPDLLKRLDAAITTLRANGEYHKINRRYFDFDIY